MNKRYQLYRKPVLLGLSVMSAMTSQAYAQEAAPAAQGQTIEVKGYRGSLETSARDKREAVGFQDSVFAEDLGKFPDTNIAESLNRIPGIQVAREITGEGLNIQIRGLGTSFTKILLNGAPVAVASTGRTDNANTNREVDLDLLPTDLFKKLTVNKSPTAAMIEGGAAGVVDMRSARPFDNEGKYVAVSLTGMQNSVANKLGNRGSVLASQTFGNKFGVLGGLAWSQAKIKTTGYETIGWTNPNLSAAQNSGTRNTTGGGNWVIPATVPANAGNGLVPGSVIDQAFLLAHNPGLTIQQIDNALVPRLSRPMLEVGDKDKLTAILSAEYRPSADLKFYIDTMYSDKKNRFERGDMNWVVRNGAVIPLNMTVDRADCSNGCVATGGTFANAQHFLEYRTYVEDVSLWGVNPGMDWKLSDQWAVDVQANLTRSKFLRDAPTVLPSTAPNSGNTVTFQNDGDLPIASTNVNLNDPNVFGWPGGRMNQYAELRNTETKGVRSNLTWGDKAFNVKAGVAYDDVSRRIVARENSAAYQAAVCGNNPSVFLLGPNGTAACTGVSTPGVNAVPTLYPGYGSGYTAGATGGVTYQGSIVPNAALPGYLIPGSEGFVMVDWARFGKDTDYARFQRTSPEVGAANTQAAAGYIRERTTGFYTEVNGVANPGGYKLSYNAGVRYVKTEQTVGGFLSVADPRNAALQNGAKFPNTDSIYYEDTSYNNVLPSASASLNLSRDVIFRASASRSMTRADPNALRPGINFSNPSADTGSLGNSGLSPYLSDNLDLGLEWYTGREGYLSATVFQKKINGFTITENVTTPFSELAAYGVTMGTLSATQQAAIIARGGPDVATAVMSRQRNAAGILKISGLELSLVQPLDKLIGVRGFGFSENITFTKQQASGEGTTGFVALGVPKLTNNFTVYYEHKGYMVRLSHSFAKGNQVSTANQNGVTNAAIFVDDFKQLDLSSSVELDDVFDRDGWPTLTFDIVNLTKESQRSYFQFSNATYTKYTPGSTISIGLRTKF